MSERDVEALHAEIARIAPVLASLAEQAELERALPHAAYDAMIEAGLFRIQAPKAFGGLELHPAALQGIVEAVARIDSAAAWNLNQSLNISGWTSRLPKAGGEEVFARGPDIVFAGGFFPPGPSVRVGGGWRVTARAAFASGCHRAEWFAVPIREVDAESSKYDPHTEDPPAIVAFVPRDEVDLVDTWHTAGMRGTFSADVVADDVFVPDERIAFWEGRPERPPPFAGALYGTVPWNGILGEACVSVGVAGAAIDVLVDLVRRKTPGYSRIQLRDRELAQHHAAEATALADASRSLLRSAITEAYADAERDGAPSERAKLRCQLAACFGARACERAVDLVHDAAGTTSIRVGQRIERHHRDVHALARHADKSWARYVDVGRMMFGLPPEYFVLKL